MNTRNKRHKPSEDTPMALHCVAYRWALGIVGNRVQGCVGRLGVGEPLCAQKRGSERIRGVQGKGGVKDASVYQSGRNFR